MKGKVFIGTWVSDETRKRLKIACAVHDVNQGDVIDLLILQWLNKPHIDGEIKELINGKKGEQKA